MLVAEDADLSLISSDGGINVWFMQAVAHITNQIAGGMIITSIYYDIIAMDNCLGILFR